MDDDNTLNGMTNGLTISNGTIDKVSSSEHKHKSKDRDRDRHRDKDRHKSSHKDKSRDKDKDRHRHKDSHRDKDKDKDSHRDKDKDKERQDKDKDKQDKDKDRQDKDKDRHRERSKDHKEHKDKDKERSKDSKDHKDKDRHGKDKDRHGKDKDRHGKDKDRHGKDKDKHGKDKDKHGKDKDRHGKDKDRHHKSSHKDRHREKDRDRDRERKHRESAPPVIEEIQPKLEVESEPIESQDFYEPKYVPELEYEPEPVTEIEYEDDSQPELQVKEEPEEEEEEDIPLSHRKRLKVETVKEEYEEAAPQDDFEYEEDKPLIQRRKTASKRAYKEEDEEYEDDDFKSSRRSKAGPKSKKIKKEKKYEVPSPTKRKKKKEEQPEVVWKWWEEEKRNDGQKWHFLEHKGPVFADPYIPLPADCQFLYDGRVMKLSQPTEEVATFYGAMLKHDYTTKPVFNKNFFGDWRRVMNSKEKEKIVDLKKCNFNQLLAFFEARSEARKNKTKEERLALKIKNEEIMAEYGWCMVDGHKQRIANFKIEPPGLFRGRGDHPKQGKLKKRTQPEDVIINCSKDSKYPKPPHGHRWKQVRHDPNVTWLASWTECILNSTKYIMLNPASRLKGEKDWQKYETARKLHLQVDKIRDRYISDWRSKEMRLRQRGVALYFIDKLALRAGNEKDEDQADTVGCCSLRVEHLTLHEDLNGKSNVVAFDFLGKDSIRYLNEVPVEKKVYKNLQLFMENKKPGDDVFDRLNTAILNKYLNELMDGLTAKVFRTYNASITLQEQLQKMTTADDNIHQMILTYNRANREVAILCNHQRAIPKSFDKSMQNLKDKIDDKEKQIYQVERSIKDCKRAAKSGSVKEKTEYARMKKKIETAKEQLTKLEISATDKEENKQIALGTSKLNYLDPRITVAWCKKFDVPIEKIFNKTHRQKFQWAIDMATDDYDFLNMDTSSPKKERKQESDEEEDDDY